MYRYDSLRVSSLSLIEVPPRAGTIISYATHSMAARAAVAARTTGGLRCGPQPDAAARAAGSAERAPRSGAHAARLVNCTFNAIIAMLQQRQVHRRRHAIAAVHHRLHRPPAPSFCGPSYPRKSHIPHSPKLPAQRLPRVAPPRGKNRSPSRLHHLDRTGKRVHEPAPRRRAKFTSEKASHR